MADLYLSHVGQVMHEDTQKNNSGGDSNYKHRILSVFMVS